MQGWDDVGFHGSPQIPTPNIDALALGGIILNNYYVSPSSFATKSEFMTGKYGTRLGKVNNNNTSLFYIFKVFHVLVA